MSHTFARSIIELIVLAGLSQTGAPFAVAQTTMVKWDAPINLSNTLTSSSNPAMVTAVNRV
jgi:hypothetical protein